MRQRRDGRQVAPQLFGVLKTFGHAGREALGKRILDAERRQALPGLGGDRRHQQQGILRPAAQAVEPFRQIVRLHLDAVEAFGIGGAVAGDPRFHGVGARHPALFQAGQLRAPSPAVRDRPATTGTLRSPSPIMPGRRASSRTAFFSAATSGQQVEQHRQRLLAQGVDLLAPVIVGGILEQRLLVADQFLVEQAAAVERVLAQHALAPGVDGEDRRLVHGFGGQHQPVRRLLACAVVGVGSRAARRGTGRCHWTHCENKRRPRSGVRAPGSTVRAWRRG